MPHDLLRDAPLIPVQRARVTCVLAHGWERSPNDWLFVARWLARDRIQLVCPDLPALAERTEAARGSLTRTRAFVDALTAAVLGWAEVGHSVHVAGHSAGAALVAAITSTTPEARTLSLIDPPPGPMGFVERGDHWSEAVDDRSQWISRRLAAVDVPTVLFRGRHSGHCSRSFANHVVDTLSATRAGVVEIRDSGHAPNLTQPRVLAESMARFMLTNENVRGDR